MTLLLVYTSILLVCAATSVSAQGVNVSVPGLDERKHKWWVWLIVSVAGASFLVSLFYVVRGMVVWRKRARARTAAIRHRAALGSADVEAGQQAEDPKTGLFSFWDTGGSQLNAWPQAHVAADNLFQDDWRKAAQVSAADEARLRQHGVGSAVQRKKECEYRMGQHVQPSLVLQRLQRHNSL